MLVLHLVLDTVVLKAGLGWKGSWHMWLEAGLDWNWPQSSFRAAAAPQLRKPAKHFRTTSTGASGGPRVQEQHIKIIKCYQMCVCSISLVGVEILSGPAWAHSRGSVLFIWTSLAARSRLPSLLIAQATPSSQGSNGQRFYVNIPLLILAWLLLTLAVSSGPRSPPTPLSSQLAPVKLFLLLISCLSWVNLDDVIYAASQQRFRLLKDQMLRSSGDVTSLSLTFGDL